MVSISYKSEGPGPYMRLSEDLDIITRAVAHASEVWLRDVLRPNPQTGNGRAPPPTLQIREPSKKPHRKPRPEGGVCYSLCLGHGGV